MSFSKEVKDELCRQFSKNRHCQIAEIAGIVRHTDNPELIEKYALLVSRAFSIDVSKPLSQEDNQKIEKALNKPTLLERTCCKRAYIRGAFLASGSISDPNKAYHFEIVCHSEELAQKLQMLFSCFEVEGKYVERKGHSVLYLKEGSQIVDALNIMEAYVALMNFENVRILKEMRNSVNRQVNCETANINKTVNAAVKQVNDIELIRDTIGLDELPDSLREMALLRLEYPEAALKELGNYLESPVGKSGVNHRLRKLAAIAEGLRGEKP